MLYLIIVLLSIASERFYQSVRILNSKLLQQLAGFQITIEIASKELDWMDLNPLCWQEKRCLLTTKTSNLS